MSDSLEHFPKAVGVSADVCEGSGLDQESHLHGRDGLEVRCLPAKLHIQARARRSETNDQARRTKSGEETERTK